MTNTDTRTGTGTNTGTNTGTGTGDRRRFRGWGGERAPLGQLSPQPWMTWPETQAVVAALQADGRGVRYIGGCVRDGLLRRPVRDVDIATPDPPEVVMALLDRAGLKAVPTGIDHGTVTAVAGGRPFEVTTLRQDVATDGRHAEVRWTEDWKADAARRDFTINALSARPEDGAIYDYFDGLDHLAHGQVVFVGRPMDRIAEDSLRILRFFRFYAGYGRPPADAAALSACRALADRLGALSAERVRDEVLGILEAETAADVLLLMRGLGVLDPILPEATGIGRLRQLVFLESRGLKIAGVAPDPLRRLGAVLDGGPSVATAVAGRLRLSNRQTARLETMSDLAEAPRPGLEAAARRRLQRRLGADGFRDRLLLAWADRRAAEGRTESAVTASLIAMLEEVETAPPPPFPLRGRDLLALGVPPGPEVGRRLAALEAWWEAAACIPDHAALLAEARRRLG
jgi:poly(A) polymerase